MLGKSLNEWNCTLEGDFSLADELTGKQRREALQNQSRKRKSEGEVRSREIVLVDVKTSEDNIWKKKNAGLT